MDDQNTTGEATPAEVKPETTTVVDDKAKGINDEVALKQQQLKELEDAKALASAELKRIREEKREARREVKTAPIEEERQIDLTDPDAKAWDKHIKSQVSPIQEEAEREKTEIRTFALDEFLKGKPALAKNPEKVKELMQVYDRIKTASERTKEGVLIDLNKAYGAVYYEQVQRNSQNQRFEQVQQDVLLSDIGVDRGSTNYPTEKTTHGKLSQDQKAILARWGMSEEAWWQDKQKYPGE